MVNRFGTGGLLRMGAGVALTAAVIPLGGCVAGMAVGAVSAVGKAAVGDGPRAAPGVDVRQAAPAACVERAATLGVAHVIDVEDRGPGRAIVWGTVGEGAQRRSFECQWAGKIVGFKLRTVGQRR
jgi:hypothetical protein